MLDGIKSSYLGGESKFTAPVTTIVKHLTPLKICYATRLLSIDALRDAEFLGEAWLPEETSNTDSWHCGRSERGVRAALMDMRRVTAPPQALEIGSS